MDGVILFILGFAVIFGPWIFCVAINTRLRRRAAEQEQQLDLINRRLTILDASFNELRRTLENLRAEKSAAQAPLTQAPAVEPAKPPERAAEAKPVSPPAEPVKPAPPPEPKPPIAPEPPKPVEPLPRLTPAEADLLRRFPIPATPSRTKEPKPQPELPIFEVPTLGASERASAGALEEKLGTNWLNKLGIGIIACYLNHWVWLRPGDRVVGSDVGGGACPRAPLPPLVP